jgi:prepilin-type N-terminal cleavage/methylation domain-containing protein
VDLKNEKGFTIVELLVVVAIIALLAAVALPQYLIFSRKSQRGEAVILLQGIYKAQLGYYAQHSSYPLNNDVFTRTGFELPPLKYHRANTLWVWNVLDPLHQRFGIFIWSNREPDFFEDAFCLVYPEDPDGSCDCLKPPTPVAQVILIADGIKNKWCHEL